MINHLLRQFHPVIPAGNGIRTLASRVIRLRVLHACMYEVCMCSQVSVIVSLPYAGRKRQLKRHLFRIAPSDKTSDYSEWHEWRGLAGFVIDGDAE